MRKLFTLSIILLLATALVAQVPLAFKYQAVVRGNNGNVLVNQLVSFRISILQGSSSGASVYIERQTLSSNDYGIVNMNVGTGMVVSGNFTTIDWGGDDYFIKVEFDATGGNNFQFMGSSQILSVPYALYAKSAGSAENDNDTNPTNELQAVNLSNDTLYLSNGGEVYLGDYLDNTDGQTLTLAGGNTLSISGGNSIVLSQGLADLDADPTNEIQNLSLNNNMLSISDGNSVSLPPDGDSSPTNEIQNLSLNNNTLSISGGNSVNLPPDGDSDNTDELQTISISNDTIFLSNGGFVIFPYNSSTNNFQLYDFGTGSMGDFISSGLDTISGINNYQNFKLQSGHSLYIDNTVMIRVQDTCIINGTVDGIGRGSSSTNSIEAGGGTGGGGNYYSPYCNGSFLVPASDIYIEKGFYYYQINGAPYGGANLGGGFGNSFPTNVINEIITDTPLPSLSGGRGGRAGCNGVSGGNGGAGLYIICRVLIFTGTINLKGGNGSSSSSGASGGGGGGSCVISTSNQLINTGSFILSGGNGGGTVPSNGGNGGAGWYRIIIQQ